MNDRETAPSAAAEPLAFPVVGIGASAGGLTAFEAFFSALPDEPASAMAFVLVQHLSPDHDSLLAELVQRHTRMQVREAADGMPVEPNGAYIIPPGHDLRLHDGRLRLSPHGSERRPHPTIDHFFSSLAQAQRERAICIVMSGTGSDGTQGVRDVKAEGGLVIAQAPESTEFDGMPRSAIDSGMVDFVLEPADMAAHLLNYVRHAFDPARRPVEWDEGADAIANLCGLLRAQTGHDFAQYKQTTLVRRMGRRMALQQIAGTQDYLRFARNHPQEVEALYRDLLIGVTQFFRDPPAFEVLEHQVLPRILAHKGPESMLRVWVAGCSSGEEAYSIAIVLHELLSAQGRPVKVQVFATDIDAHALDRARAGIYPASIAAQVGEARLARFFSHDAEHGTYRVHKEIRNLLVFSEQNLIRDPPFSRLDLIACRNLLIYLDADLQKRLIPLFHFALNPGGALFLGTSETVGEFADLFKLLDRRSKLHWRLEADRSVHRPVLPALFQPTADVPRRAVRAAAPPDEAGTLRHLIERALIAYYAPVAALVTARGQILHIHGRTGQFLEPADGDAGMNVLTMARDGLRHELTVALHRAVTQKTAVRSPNLNVKANGHYLRADLAVSPVERAGTETAYLVILHALPDAPAGEPPDAAEVLHERRIDDLETALRNKEEYLQSTLEEMETTNEELKSTNEEMQSVNEELQSTNEELETSKEELQSVNEELSTVNVELQDRVADLSRANNDMNNLLAGTGVGTVFVDLQLRIARFTPAATAVLNLIPADVGRPLAHVTTRLVGYDRMADDLAHVLETQTALETEVQVKAGNAYLMRMQPYRTVDGLVHGAVLTLVDISARRQAEQALRASEARLAAFVQQAYAGVAETDLQGRLLFANDRLCTLLGQPREALLGQTMAALTLPDDAARVEQALQQVARGVPEVRLRRRYRDAKGSSLMVEDRISAIRADPRDAAATLLWLSLDLANE